MNPDTPPPKLAASYLKRALLAAVLVVTLSAGGVSAAGIVAFEELVQTPSMPGRLPIKGIEQEIDPGDIDGPRTLLLLGTDARYGDTEKPRADTMVLVRLDPDGEAIAMTSVPRDLLVTIPGVGSGVKMNSAYHEGGPRLTVKTIKTLLSTPQEPFEINHVAEVDFRGFREAIDFIGCVYIDIDRDYFNDRGGPGGYATIDIDPGYQKICGRKALDYVRYRHGDNDLVRNVRQQDFLRQVKDQTAVQEVLTWDRRREVIKLVDTYLKTDRALRHDRRTLTNVLRLMFYTKDKPVVSIPFRSHASADNINIVANRGELRATVQAFMSPEVAGKSSIGKQATEPDQRAGDRAEKKRKPAGGPLPGLQDMRVTGENQAVLAARQTRKSGLAVYFPKVGPVGSQYDHSVPRMYWIRDETGQKRRSYRMVLRKGEVLPEYYGIQGTRWAHPPILDNPTETVRRGKRNLELFYEGKKLRIVAWRTPEAAYWVSNSLTKSLGNRQMIAMAESLKRLGG